MSSEQPCLASFVQNNNVLLRRLPIMMPVPGSPLASETMWGSRERSVVMSMKIWHRLVLLHNCWVHLSRLRMICWRSNVCRSVHKPTKGAISTSTTKSAVSLEDLRCEASLVLSSHYSAMQRMAAIQLITKHLFGTVCESRMIAQTITVL